MSAMIMERPVDEFVAAASGGDIEAQARLYEALAPDVHRFLVGLRLGLGHQDQEDALQETFVRLLRGLDRVDPQRGGVRAYALGIARNVALDRCRKQVLDAGSEVNRVAANDPTASSQVARVEERALVEAALEALGPEHASVLALRFLNGLTMESLASALGCSVPTARKRLRDASRLLRGALREQGVDLRTEEPA